MVAAPIPLSPAPQARLSAASVFVRGLKVDAQIGIYGHEHGRTQPLIIDVELAIDARHFEQIGDTVNYETILAKARAIAEAGHMKLVETFAETLARACLEDGRCARVRVRVEKPEALAPHAQAAGVELILERP